MQIAICDDDKSFRKELVEYLIAYKKQSNICIDIFEYDTGESLLSANEYFDMIYLDYQMPGIDGLETARILRTKNITCSIVFVTNYPDFVFESFEVNPFRFIPKPITQDKVNNLLNTFISNQKLLAPVIVINNNEKFVIEAKKILYLEGNGKNCKIITNERIYESSKTLSRVQEILPQHCFYRVHKSFVVNLYSIKQFDSKTILLTNGSTIDISRNKRSDFKNTYLEFVKNYYVRT